MKKSANHHMNSSAVAWFIKQLVGLEQKKGFITSGRHSLIFIKRKI